SSDSGRAAGAPFLLAARLEFDERDLRRAREPERQSDNAYPACGVQRHRSDLVEPGRVFARQRRKVRRSQTWDTDLTTMGVAGKLQVNRITGAMVGNIRLMGQEHDRLAARDACQGNVVVRKPGHRIVHSSEPEPYPVMFNRETAIHEYVDPTRLQGVPDARGVGPMIVVPQHGAGAKARS